MTPSAPALDLEDKPLANFTSRNVLETLRELNPGEVQSLLRDAQLERLLTADLRDGAPPAVRTSELARLYATMHRLMGETLTRIFLSNYGHKMAPLLLQHPELQKKVEAARALAGAERLGFSVSEVQRFLNAVWADVAVREDAEAYYLEVERCPICALIRGTHAPICASSEFIYTALLRAVSGMRISAIEIGCRAQGGRCCSYRVRK